jgi:hypothetical protein
VARETGTPSASLTVSSRMTGSPGVTEMLPRQSRKRLPPAFEQARARRSGLIAEAGGKAGAFADRVAQPLAAADEGAAALFGAQHAFLFERGDGGAHGVAIHAVALGQFISGGSLPSCPATPVAMSERIMSAIWRHSATPDFLPAMHPSNLAPFRCHTLVIHGG